MNVRRALVGVGLALSVPVWGAAQTADEIVAKNIAAKGGMAQLKAVKAMRISGHVTVGPDQQIALSITTERPNKLRQESRVQEQQIVVAFDGDTAWTINPMMGSTTPQAILGPELDRLRTQADMDGPLVDYKSKGTTIELLGTELVGDVKANKLKITRKDGQSQTLYLDATTGLEVKAVNDVVQGGQSLTIESLFSNYKTVDGLTIAHTIKQKVGGREATVTLDKVELLSDIDDSIFKMPGK